MEGIVKNRNFLKKTWNLKKKRKKRDKKIQKSWKSKILKKKTQKIEKNKKNQNLVKKWKKITLINRQIMQKNGGIYQK